MALEAYVFKINLNESSNERAQRMEKIKNNPPRRGGVNTSSDRTQLKNLIECENLEALFKWLWQEEPSSGATLPRARDCRSVPKRPRPALFLVQPQKVER